MLLSGTFFFFFRKLSAFHIFIFICMKEGYSNNAYVICDWLVCGAGCSVLSPSWSNTNTAHIIMWRKLVLQGCRKKSISGYVLAASFVTHYCWRWDGFTRQWNVLGRGCCRTFRSGGKPRLNPQHYNWFLENMATRCTCKGDCVKLFQRWWWLISFLLQVFL